MGRIVSNGNKFILIGKNSTSVCSSTIETTSSATIWRGGYVTDNFSTYYLDENMVKYLNQ